MWAIQVFPLVASETVENGKFARLPFCGPDGCFASNSDDLLDMTEAMGSRSRSEEAELKKRFFALSPEDILCCKARDSDELPELSRFEALLHNEILRLTLKSEDDFVRLEPGEREAFALLSLLIRCYNRTARQMN